MLNRTMGQQPLLEHGVAAEPTTGTRGNLLWRSVGLAIAGTALIAASAHVAIPLPFTPVPFTLQPLAVLLVGLLLGPALGFTTLCLYLLEGVAGLPVFAPTGLGGAAQLLGPTGGYLFAYPAVAAVAGGLYRVLHFPSRYAAAATAGTVATGLLFLVGAARLASLLHLSLHAAMMSAVLPFLPGECVKLLAASGIATAWHARRS